MIAAGRRGQRRADPVRAFALDDVLDSRIWTNMAFFMNDEMQTTMFQPVGGMGMIGKAFAKQVEPMLTYNAKVTRSARTRRA
jgi:monoamine oxidase